MTSTLILIAIMLGVMYLMVIRPENKRKKEAEQLRSSLKVGDNVTTIGGIIGNIVNIKDDHLVIETSEDRVRIELLNWAVMTNNTAVKNQAKAREEARAKAKAQAEERAKKKAEKKNSKKEK